MPCKISPWIIQNVHLNDVSKKLFESDVERAGGIVFDNDGMISSKIILNSDGEKDSVKIDLQKNHMISFHTHPAAAYINAECVYGHPSGDDIREFVRLALSGALNHGVFSLEGFYLIQIHPKFVKYMMTLSKNKRKYILDGLYEYFRKFHGQRSYINVKQTQYTPREFITACNTLNLSDINLPRAMFGDRHVPKRLLSCVWFYCDDLLDREKDYDTLWEGILQKRFSVAYNKRSLPITFKFLHLNSDERALDNILEKLSTCVLSD